MSDEGWWSRRRRERAERQTRAREEHVRERLDQLTRDNPHYGTLRELEIKVYIGVNINDFLARVERDGLYDVVSMTPGKGTVPGQRHRLFSFTSVHLRMKAGR